jgi:signal transduction histidine kinase
VNQQHATGTAATTRAARAAAGWLRMLGRDLSPLAAPGPEPPRRERTGWWRWSPRATVALCAVAVLGFGTLDLYQHYRLSVGAAAALSAARALPLLLCLSRPLAGWWLTLAAATLTAVLADPVSAAEPWPWPVTSVLALVVALVVVERRVPRRVLVELWLLLVGVTAAAWLAEPDRRDWSGLATVIVASAVALLLADALRGRDQARRRLADQEQVSEAERARRVLLEERARIARELHDVVAHHMSVIAIQAEAAPHRVADPPAELTRSLTDIRANALQALDELRRVLGVLRAEGPEEDGAAPQPTLDRIGDLVAGVRGADVTVETAVSGTPRPLPPGVELSAYRIVQEALSNAVRHAPGASVRVELAYAATDLGVRVTNGPPRTAAPVRRGAGHGMLGMRERAAMLGGELAAGPTPDGGYAVAAVLPLPGDADT